VDRYGLPSVFDESFPEFPGLGSEEQEPVRTVPLLQREAYFKLNVPGPEPVVPAQLLPHLGRIHTGAEWEDLGFFPYSVEIVGLNAEEGSCQAGSFELDGYSYSFTPMVDLPDDLLNLPELEAIRTEVQEWAVAFKEEKRHVTVANEVYFLRRLAVSYDEISNLSEYDRQYAEGCLAMDRQDYSAAVGCLEAASRLNPNECQCRELLFEAKAKSGDVGVIEEELAFYANDMDSAIHTGSAERWLRLAIDLADDYRLALDAALKTIGGVEAQISGKTDPRKSIYGTQSVRYYEGKRDQFVKRLGTLRGFLSRPLIEANRDRAGELRTLLRRIAQVSPAKSAKIHELSALLGAEL